MTLNGERTMREIPLTQGRVALVDDEDYAAVAGYRWYAKRSRGTWYAHRATTQANGRPTTVSLHRTLLPGAAMVDHADGDGLNNRRENLRPATRSQNGANRRMQRNNASGYRGVSWHSGRERWSAQLQVAGRQRYLGLFDDPADAARAYDDAAVKAHGDFARLNFPEDRT